MTNVPEKYTLNRHHAISEEYKLLSNVRLSEQSLFPKNLDHQCKTIFPASLTTLKILHTLSELTCSLL